MFALVSSGHSGNTDSKGGHYNHKTGKYHYIIIIMEVLNISILLGFALIFFSMEH
jgi:hypothetical protein